ncbi:hypothetical protein Mal52_45290 [Symmachiella dynata]|uniref:DUF7336 domain-containing protein n=1 Tax=Symmachiella dynata TaxID=2527995 RepID=A0A517ZU85_9PLAN|nr:SPOR domain-containing protein [Symmachiella dynata]QDU46032.1 hypothetical protein Mal52_45290 [Symmachiella dynata]
MKSVFTLFHEYERLGRDECKIIGVYATKDEAERAISRLRTQPGFRDWSNGFSIDEYTIGEDHWTEGFSTIVPIYIPMQSDDSNQLVCAHAEWLPGNRFRIIEYPGEVGTDVWQYKPGNVVICEERRVEGTDGCMVAVARANDIA